MFTRPTTAAVGAMKASTAVSGVWSNTVNSDLCRLSAEQTRSGVTGRRQGAPGRGCPQGAQAVPGGAARTISEQLRRRHIGVLILLQHPRVRLHLRRKTAARSGARRRQGRQPRERAPLGTQQRPHERQRANAAGGAWGRHAAEPPAGGECR